MFYVIRCYDGQLRGPFPTKESAAHYAYYLPQPWKLDSLHADRSILAQWSALKPKEYNHELG